MVTGTNGNQLEDTASISQATVETCLAVEEANHESCIKVLEWLEDAQVGANLIWMVKETHDAVP